MEPDARLKTAIYRHVADTGRLPDPAAMARASAMSREEVRQAYRRLAARRVLVLESDGETIRMAPPFSGVETQHRVRVGTIDYYANCAWDALGIPAALRGEGEVWSRCEQSMEPLHLEVSREGPLPEPCVIHFAVPAAHWWDDIVHT
jgi:alkylmercury lyase-like protein